MSEGTRESCSCSECRSACTRKPGWFLPGEAEKAAAYVGLPLPKFFQQKLAVDYWLGSKEVFLLSPATTNGIAGQEFPGNPRGRCVFYKDGLCEIHPVKPYECRMMLHATPRDNTHEKVKDAWIDHQDQVRELLGREPVAAEFSLWDLL